MNERLHNLLMLYRPMAHMVKAAVIPEIEKRVAAGTIPADGLPMYVHRFQVLMGAGKMQAQINDDVRIVFETVAKRTPIQAGELLTLNDIDPETAHLVPPEIDGKRAAFYSMQSFFLTVMGFFDFSPNGPDGPSPGKMSYPVIALAQAKDLKERLKPDEAIAALRAKDWPPGRLFHPGVLLSMSEGVVPGSEAFLAKTKGAYSKEQLDLWCDFWQEVGLFPSRIAYVRHATERYFAGDFISAVRTIAPEFEGVMREHILGCGQTPPRNQRPTLATFRALILSRKILMFSPTLLDTILEFIESSFMGATETVQDPNTQINRHGLAHGIFGGVETEEAALKYLVLFDALAFVIFHDRLVTHRLT